ncbi:MAG: extracellular solute-binding protein [Treponema sp.]|jgi:multiple sugar transport system substrate-binding protein/putative aldouronate transport system substrate-binding protein|nr:extracellular solute-binding protein [Treponema sp.]
MKKTTVIVFVLMLTIFSGALFLGCSKQEASESGSASAAPVSNAPMTIVLYDVAANYQGNQPGWFGKVLKDKFNIELNVIAPQIAGDGKALFQTRAAAGDLGDIVILDNADFLDCIAAGLVQDISKDVEQSPNVMVFNEQIKKYNADIPGAGGKIYGIPTQMTNTSPTAYSLRLIYSSPQLPWDYFTEIGAPRLRNLNDLLDALEKIQKAHPTNAAGDKAYAISLWPDWDGTSIETANQTLKWYGAEVRNSVLLDTKNNMKPLTDDAGEYRKMLRFFFDATQRGLVDPDSGTQNWDQMVIKMQNKRVYLHWYEWQRGFWNSPTHGNARENYIAIPVDDMYFFQDGDFYYGDGRVLGVGSKVTGAKRERVLQFIDWLASPEGLEYCHNGIKGFNYTVLPDGTFERTPEGEVSFSANPPVPAEWGGGGWNDGNQKINTYVAHVISIDPNTKYPYEYSLWPAEIEKAKTTTNREWEAMYGAQDPVDYFTKNNQLGIVPSVNVMVSPEPTDIQLIRSQCATIVKDTSWKMIFAANEAEFNKLWADMKTQLTGFGWDKLVEYDREQVQAVVDARNEALARAR